MTGTTLHSAAREVNFIMASRQMLSVYGIYSLYHAFQNYSSRSLLLVNIHSYDTLICKYIQPINWLC